MPEDEVLKAIDNQLKNKVEAADATPDAVKQLLSLRKEYLEQNEAKEWASFRRRWLKVFFVALFVALFVAALFMVWWLRKG